MESTKLMCHWVTYAKECICECHTCHSSCVTHLLSCDRIVRTIVVSSWEILKYHLKRTECKTICEVCSHHWSISLKSMCYSIDTGSRGKSLRGIHHHVGINDCHLRKELVICKWVLNSCSLVCDNRERCNLRTCTCWCRNSDEVCLLTHLRECINTLTDIAETHCHIKEVNLRVLIHNPHNLTCVHCWTTADCYNTIRLEGSHSLRTLCSGSKWWIRCYIIEGCVLDSKLVKLICDMLGVSVRIEELICYDKYLLLIHYSLKLLKCNRKTALLNIYLLRCSEPKHVLSPLSNSLYVD